LEAAGSRTEAIGLPPNIDLRNGELTVRLDPSLAAGMRDGLNYLEHFDYECTEQTVSRFLPNVLTARALKKLGIANAELEAQFNDESLTAELPDFPFARELKLLWELATVLEASRGRPEQIRTLHMDYNFYVEDDQVRIVERRRGSPVDKLVSEMMILVNSEWGRVLADAGIAAIYRVQSNGKVRMSTFPSAHQGLGVAQYAWTSSPLRRYVDLVNQRQLIAWHRGEPAPYTSGGEQLLAVMRDFELASDVYAEFQRNMERYWCLRWMIQESVDVTVAEVIRENLVKIDQIPLIVRVVSVPTLEPGVKVALKISDIDPLELTFHAEYIGPA
jgi:exoribonuclease-2